MSDVSEAGPGPIRLMNAWQHLPSFLALVGFLLVASASAQSVQSNDELIRQLEKQRAELGYALDQLERRNDSSARASADRATLKRELEFIDQQLDALQLPDLPGGSTAAMERAARERLQKLIERPKTNEEILKGLIEHGQNIQEESRQHLDRQRGRHAKDRERGLFDEKGFLRRLNELDEERDRMLRELKERYRLPTPAEETRGRGDAPPPVSPRRSRANQSSDPILQLLEQRMESAHGPDRARRERELIQYKNE